MRHLRAGFSPSALLACALTVGSCATLSGCLAPASRDPLRRTALVDVFAACKDSVIRFTATRVEDKIQTGTDGKSTGKHLRVTHTQWGSGCVLHEAGYVLSNSHMLKFEGTRTASLYDGTTYPVRVIAADETNDLAVLKVESARPLKPLRLGHSAGLMVGEPAITMGNPFGIGLTMDAGIVSGVGRNIKTEYAVLTDMIQTDASINPGNSGGPLLDIHGDLIGVCTSTKLGAENIGFAISIDHIRTVLRELLAPEARNGFILGIQVAADGPARVTAVAKGSPAEAAGVRVGDVVAAVSGQPVRNQIDFLLALVERKAGQTLAVQLRRGWGGAERMVKLEPVKLRPAEQVANLAPGLNWKFYEGGTREGEGTRSEGRGSRQEENTGKSNSSSLVPPASGLVPPTSRLVPPASGLAPPASGLAPPASGLSLGQWKQLPDFDRLTPAATGTMAAFGLGPFAGKEWFGLKIAGYVDAPADGVYSFWTRSDDGSRLWIGDQLVVDNDGLHPAVERRGFISLKAGKHPIAVAYFQGPGESELKVFWESPALKRQEIPAAALFH